MSIKTTLSYSFRQKCDCVMLYYIENVSQVNLGERHIHRIWQALQKLYTCARDVPGTYIITIKHHLVTCWASALLKYFHVLYTEMSETKRWVVNYPLCISLHSQWTGNFVWLVCHHVLTFCHYLNAIHSYQSLETSPELWREGTKLLRRGICGWRTCPTNRMQDGNQSGLGWLSLRFVRGSVSRNNPDSGSSFDKPHLRLE